MVVDVFDDRMARVGDPEDFALVGVFTPFEIAARAHQFLEDLGEVPAVEDDQAHAFEDAVINALDDQILRFAVISVAPPDEHIGVVQHLFG